MKNALFPLGLVAMTSAVEESVPGARASECLMRHAQGDWGDICDEDRELNNIAKDAGSRLMSVYPIDPSKPCEHGENCFWIITEADRSLTTLLLPSEY